jgi:hypothetical protein
MTTLEKFEMPHIATIDVEGRRYNVALRIDHDGVEFVGRLWFSDEAWAEDDGIVDQGVLPGRTAELVVNHAQSLGERELVQRYRRALAQRRRFHALRRLTVEVLENIRHLNALATSMRAGLVEMHEAAAEIDLTEDNLHELIDRTARHHPPARIRILVTRTSRHEERRRARVAFLDELLRVPGIVTAHLAAVQHGIVTRISEKHRPDFAVGTGHFQHRHVVIHGPGGIRIVRVATFPVRLPAIHGKARARLPKLQPRRKRGLETFAHGIDDRLPHERHVPIHRLQIRRLRVPAERPLGPHAFGEHLRRGMRV